MHVRFYKLFCLGWVFLFAGLLHSSELGHPKNSTIVILLHPNPARHWAQFAKEMPDQFRILSAEAASKELDKNDIAYQRFYSGGVPIVNLSSEDRSQLVSELVETCLSANRIIIDSGHAFSVEVLKEFKKKAPAIKRVVYYDNPEPYVPGEYSREMAKAIHMANAVLFANKNLVEKNLFESPCQKIDVEGKERYGLGYYPLEEITQIQKIRHSQERLVRRAIFFKQHGLEEKGQRILVYLGGANEEYYTRAFPAFVKLMQPVLGKLSPTMVVIQQHPRAATQDGNKDIRQLPGSAPFIVSKEKDSNSLLALADAVLYYQTSASPKFVLAGIPAIQIGHEPFQDIVVAAGFVPSVTQEEELLSALKDMEKQQANSNYEAILEKLGVDLDWKIRLSAFFDCQ
jgi:hypothetical protein